MIDSPMPSPQPHQNGIDAAAATAELQERDIEMRARDIQVRAQAIQDRVAAAAAAAAAEAVEEPPPKRARSVGSGGDNIMTDAEMQTLIENARRLRAIANEAAAVAAAAAAAADALRMPTDNGDDGQVSAHRVGHDSTKSMPMPDDGDAGRVVTTVAFRDFFNHPSTYVTSNHTSPTSQWW